MKLEIDTDEFEQSYLLLIFTGKEELNAHEILYQVADKINQLVFTTNEGRTIDIEFDMPTTFELDLTKLEQQNFNNN